MFIIFAATLALLPSYTETVSTPPYKSATEVFKGLTEMSDAEFEEFKKSVYKHGKVLTLTEACKTNKAFEEKIKTMEMKLIKLMKPARTFVFKVLKYTLMELQKKGSQAQKLQEDFDKLRKNKKACENLLSSYPQLKLGQC